MTATSEHERIVEWLKRPDAYPHPVESVQFIETHISCVFLAGSYVYKLKKPVRYDFLDFSTIDAREHACREELRLNRRLAPETYLDVIKITRGKEGQLQLGGDGLAIDWLVQMRRLPTEQTLEALYRRGELRPEHIERLAQVLVDFYQRQQPLPWSPEAYRARCLDHVRGNRRELLAVGHHLPAAVVQRVHAFQLQLLHLCPGLFGQRVRQGRVIDGHGDLRPEHICLADPPVIFDCIEFSPDFRAIDMADELAFLAAECDFLGATWVGPQLLSTYERLTGDHPNAELWSYYLSYRTCVRAKVAALRADQVTGPPCALAASEARRQLDLADHYAAPWVRPLVLLVGGITGTGKTILATAVADALGAELLRTDVLRKELFGQGKHGDAKNSGIYRPESRERVYDLLLSRAAELHAEGVSVILDGTFSTIAPVERARGIALPSRDLFLAVECVCRPEVARERIAKRSAEGRDASESRPEIHDLQRSRWQPWPAAIAQIRVDTEPPLEQQVQQVVARLAVMRAVSANDHSAAAREP